MTGAPIFVEPHDEGSSYCTSIRPACPMHPEPGREPAEYRIISRELHDQAAAAWTAARERVMAARRELADAQAALRSAEDELAGQEACPGIPAWFHAQQVTAANCRLESCSIHDEDRWAEEVPF